GLYLLVGGTVTAARAVTKKAPAAAGFRQLHDVSSIWFERNVLLRNTIWPRDAHLEVLEPEEGLRIAKRETPKPVRVRAWKYVVADRNAPQGWRLWRWQEVFDRPGLVGQVPQAPEDWK